MISVEPQLPQDAIKTLAQLLSAEWKHIELARRNGASLREQLNSDLAKHTSEDTSVVLYGSVARLEVTAESDLDWVLLVDGSSSPEHMTSALEIDHYLQQEEKKKPGQEATFGGLVFGHDLLHYIGGEDDTNRNLTQRMLLLLESTAIGRDDAHRRVVHNVLKRYVVEDFDWMQAGHVSTMPRFLLNDIVRYWRTIAVDFAYKRRQRKGKGWALRTAKLRLSRKLIYAAGLLRCYLSATNEKYAGYQEDKLSVAHELVANMAASFRDTPLDAFAQFFLNNRQFDEVAREFFAVYDEFLAILDDKKARGILNSLTQDNVAKDEVFQAVRTLGQRFQVTLDRVFFDNDLHPEFFKLTSKYALF